MEGTQSKWIFDNTVYNFTARPYWITEGPKDINAAEGETAEFTCEAAGRKTPEVKWFVNGIDVRSKYIFWFHKNKTQI